MFDINKIKRIAKEIGVEVNPLDATGKSGLYFRNESGQLQKWDAIAEFGLNKMTAQRSNQSNNFFDKDFYITKNSDLVKTPYNNKARYYLTQIKSHKATIITEAA
ncbi:hypothetical protein [Staphylococcus intermedius]|uniref:Uncharacterized protein n=1 Tax=Staphylococcus intermedius NCTC 11048 TaxID=1141106 RepID=A0A380GAU8_STAIN|nr:hypothetical protein [Staphylococcus intermedius]PCF65430.1 hypothetical protein B5C04_05100 [Staphylococcus intermedius]PCF81108.1 hypothetical protein B4W74_05450 [Staphylococcus intermedius]PCF82390.1 hypothetical protein B4W70_05095 [Staphylococcus intermedius]PCF87091.1 hypothetical protein B4W75_08365 [Staphylococcus intermedius]PCF87649.1 hypothetical protein B4W76_04490 [Staphylococcus intermedius]